MLATRASWVGSPRGQLPLNDAARLGGLLNLTGFASGQLLGDEVAYAHVRGERIIGPRPRWACAATCAWAWRWKRARWRIPYTVQRKDGWLNSVAVYLGGETPVGPAVRGRGAGLVGGSVNAYLVIGVP